MVSVIKVIVWYCYVCCYQTENLDSNLNYRYHLHNNITCTNYIEVE